MKTLLLIGDSIRMGYQPLVTKLLEGRWIVRGPEENGGTSRNVLANLDAWAAQPADVVHINCGLHDLARSFESTVNRVPRDEYAANVREVLGRLTARGGRIIWATTTPVIDEWHHLHKKFDRHEADVLAYNVVATTAAQGMGIPVDDLHAVIEAAGREQCLQPDGVHMIPAGYARLADAVVACL